MNYNHIEKGIFLARPNRFIAHVLINGKMEIVHVKNTGRCKELLTENAQVFVQKCPSPTRKTQYDLISVYKGQRLINMDSQAPNKVVAQWLQEGNLFQNITLIKPETTYGNSRFDFYLEADDQKILIEVKGVTLEENGVALFPDAPTQRGIKHIQELCASLKDGFSAYLIFVIQMNGILYFSPNNLTHPAFGQALIHAQAQGVKIIALDCDVTPDCLTAKDLIDVRLL